jgi:hypothetical protein
MLERVVGVWTLDFGRISVKQPWPMVRSLICTLQQRMAASLAFNVRLLR